MENTAPLINWVLKNKKKLNIKVTRLNWTDSWLPGFHDYQTEMTIHDQTFIGRGTDQNEELAFGKSISEIFEGLATSFSPINAVTGIAAHPDINIAKENAYLELLAFDRAFCHYYSQMPFKIIDLSVLENKSQFEKIKFKLENRDLCLNIYELTPTLDAVIVVAFIWNYKIPNKGFVAGFGCSKNLNSATYHAVLECLRESVAIFIYNQPLPKNLNNLFANNRPEWHFWNNLNLNSLTYLQTNLIKNHVSLLPTENINISTVNFNHVKEVNQMFEDLPIYVVSSESEKLITPQFGNFSITEKNSERLSLFKKENIVINFSQSHFYG